MKDANIEPLSVKAIVITHEHSDHIKGVAQFAGKFRCPVFIHKAAVKCFQHVGQIPMQLIQTFDDSFDVDDIRISFFPLPHDSEFCFGYSFQNAGAKISVATDLGSLPADAMNHMRGSQIVMIESNYDPIRLRASVKYPAWLKRRVRDTHLSNNACCECVEELSKDGLQQVILAHTSQENNSPTLAYSCMCEFLQKRGIIEGEDIFVDVAEQDKVSIMFQVD